MTLRMIFQLDERTEVRSTVNIVRRRQPNTENDPDRLNGNGARVNMNQTATNNVNPGMSTQHDWIIDFKSSNRDYI